MGCRLLIMLWKRSYSFLLSLIALQHLLCFACQTPLPSYLQLLPKDLWHETMNCTLSTAPLWQDKEEDNRVEQALRFNALAKELCNLNLQHMIISRMQADLSHANKEILEPYYPDYNFKLNRFDDFFNYGASRKKPEKDPLSPDNPKNFINILPLKNILSYYESDKEWVKIFLMTKNCGGTLRKHIFLCAMTHRNEELVNLLWNNNYRKKLLLSKMWKRPFIRMASCVAYKAGYAGIHAEFKQMEDKIKAKIKASQVWYPG